MGIFVKVEFDQARFSTQQARELCARSCPVDILRATETSIEIDAESEDECILCDLCVHNAPEGAVEIIRTYAEFMRT